ncbi:TPA: hypothetical protein N0F65_006082 [Lagenidium giganteum]|uniref:BTB domain-containing protein n=1 Tax=Lagenidium giganteum TaxID=4803 RepID=A0AAV2YN76_9STRA|nr:TPA: hypothetical protein N0F65_006082 [Lagenidium giganteum]
MSAPAEVMDDVKASAAVLEAMQSSTQRLDDILKQLCAENISDPLVHDPLVNELSLACEELDVDAVRARLRASPVESTRAYVSVVTGAISKGQMYRVPHHALLVPPLGASSTHELLASDDALDQVLRELTDVTFVVARRLSAVLENNETRASALSSQIERELVLVDHLMPAAARRAMATFALNEWGRQCLLAQPASLVAAWFPAADVAHWEAKPLSCTIHVDETAVAQQWGVQLRIATAFVVRLTDEHGDVDAGATMKLKVQVIHTFFLSKLVWTRRDSKEADVDTDDASSTHAVSAFLSLFEVSDSQTEPAVTTLAPAPAKSHQPATSPTERPAQVNVAPLPEFTSLHVFGRPGIGQSLEPVREEDDDDQLDHGEARLAGSPVFERLVVRSRLPRNRIVHAAASRLHTLLLNDVGMVFSYGDGLDGALGHGNFDHVSTPKLIDFFFDNILAVETIMCGADAMAGAHSVAVLSTGKVFSWGVGIALGTGSVQTSNIPLQAQFPADEDVKIRAVACGSAFSVAISTNGDLYSWGKWSDGRLGLGLIPVMNKSSRRSGNRKQLQQYQLFPARCQGVLGNGSAPVRWTKIACGEAHCVGLSTVGEIYTWGRGSHGQLGHGNVKDALSPVRLMIDGVEKWTDVAAGADWSMALSSDGHVWTWGACGRSILGHISDDQRSGSIKVASWERQHGFLRRARELNKDNPHLPAHVPRLAWMAPRQVACFAHDDITIQCLSAGLHHGAAVSTGGDLYVWGEGSNLWNRGLKPIPSLVADIERGSSGIGSLIAERVFCGGDQTLVIGSGSFLANSMRQLFTKGLQLSNATAATEWTTNGYFDNETAADVQLIAGGKVLYGHKLILARRSAKLRDDIFSEERSLVTPQHQVVEIILPGIRFDVAKLLLEFIYTDNVSWPLEPQSFLIRDLMRAAQIFNLSSLERLCHDRIVRAAAADTFVEVVDDQDGAIGADPMANSLNQDLEYAFRDTTWTDVTFVAEGRAIHAHKCLLIARSEYFRALLAFPRHEQSSFERDIIHVDESFMGMLRVLNFIYHDQVPTAKPEKLAPNDDAARGQDEDESEQLLDDLIAADKFGLDRMKRLCEHRVELSLTNCLDVLVIADMVRAHHLKYVAMRFIQTHLAVVTHNKVAFQRLQQEFPTLLEELYSGLQQRSQEEWKLQQWSQQIETLMEQQHRERHAEQTKKASETPFPWLPMVLALVFAVLYGSIFRFQDSVTVAGNSLVPAVNLVVIIGIIGAGLAGLI